MACFCAGCLERMREDYEEDMTTMSESTNNKNTWPCQGTPEDLAGQPIGMYHCEFCGEMQLAGVPHLPPQFPSQWEGTFPKVEEPPDYGPDDDDEAPPDDAAFDWRPSSMVSFPTSPVRMESIELIGPPHTRPALDPPSSCPTSSMCPQCGVADSVTFRHEEEHFPYGVAPHIVDLSAVVDKGRCSACSFEFTDWRAEDARTAAVNTHLLLKTCQK